MITEIRLHAGETGDGSMLPKVIKLLGQRQVTQAIAVVREELFFVSNDAFDCPQPLSNVRLQPSLHERLFPIVNVASHQIELLAAFGKNKVVGEALAVIEKIVLDDVAAVSETEHEILVPEMGVVLHHVPKNRAISDRHHRLRYAFAGLSNPHPETAAKQHYFHVALVQNAFI